MANPFDASTKEEVTNLIKSVLATFTLQYTKHYAICLIKKLQEDKEEGPSPWKLLEREPSKDDLKAGYLVKEGAIRKNWKKRWFIVRHDFSVDYFTDEKTAQKEKPKAKGSMQLAGYWVETELGNSLLKRAQDLATKMGVDVSQLPKPKTYPPNTIEIYHSRRRSWYIQFQSEEEKNEWVEVFKTCCRRAWGLRNRDPVHMKAFHKAIRATRWQLGRWGYWSGGGSEEQVLTDLITDEIDWSIMDKVYSKMTGPYMVRSSIRSTVLKTIDTLVSAAVTPAWKAMSTVVEQLRATVEPKLSTLVDPIGSAKAAITEKMTDSVMSAVNPLLDQHVKPHIKKIVEVLVKPVKDAYEASFEIFNEAIKKFAETTTDMTKPNFKELNWVSRNYWTMLPSTSKLDVMYDPLYALREIFPDISPWSLVWKGQDQLRQKMDNAAYTFEERFKKKMEENPQADKSIIEEIRLSVVEEYQFDSEVHKTMFYTEIIKIIVMPPLTKVLGTVTGPILEPLQGLIPDPVQQFVDLQEEFDNFVDSLVDKLIESLLDD